MVEAVAKTCTYSIMHFVVAFCVAYAISGNLHVALGISLVEPLVQTVAYVIHEKAWKKHSKFKVKVAA